MKYTILINQTKSIEWGLNLSQAALFAFCFELPSWADPIQIQDQTFYFSSKNKILDELPLLTEKPDTIYRILKQLEEKGLIVIKKVGNKDFIKLTGLSREWSSEKNPGSENFPGLFGKKSESGSEKNPTYNNTILDTNTIIREEQIKFCRKLIDYVKANPSKYPKLLYINFARHWMELSNNGKKMRFQGEKFFEIGKRLSTWFSNCNDAKISEYWAAENSTPALNEQLKNLLKPIKNPLDE
jgi:hypothetical protein